MACRISALLLVLAVCLICPAQPPSPAPKPTPEVQKLIDTATDDKTELKDGITMLQAALIKAREMKDRCGEGTCLFWIGRLYHVMRDYPKALQFYEQALPINRAVGDRRREAWTLNNIGSVYDELGQRERALEYYEQALPIRREVGDRKGEATTLHNLGSAYDNLGQRGKALQCYEQALPLWQAVGDRRSEAVTLSNIGLVYNNLGQRDKALQYYERALQIQRAVGDRRSEAVTLSSIGLVYDYLGQREKALEYYEQALPIRRAVGDREGEATTLNNIGGVYSQLGQRERALQYYEQAVQIQREAGNRQGEATALTNIGAVYVALGQLEKALLYEEQALPLWRAVGDRQGEAKTLGSIGVIYDHLGQLEKALQYYQQALPILQTVRDRDNEATALSNIGLVYDHLGQREKSLHSYEQALPILRAVGDREGEAVTLGNLAYVYRATSPNLAIWYRKHAVNLYQSLRKDIAGLSQESRESYKMTIADSYRDLADLLIAQGRIPEAEQVLRLLKDDEVYEFVRRSDTNLGGMAAYTPAEAQLDLEYEDQTKGLTELGAKTQGLLSLKERTPAQEAELKNLSTKLAAAEKGFQDFVDRILAKSKTLNVAANRLEKIGDSESIQKTLSHLPIGTVAVYTLAAPDALRIIFITATTIRAHTVAIKSADLNKNVEDFRKALQNPSADPKPAGKELYDALVKPIEEDLKGSGAKTIMWSLDGSLRYIPIAALWDGQHYLVERFNSCIFNPSSAGDLTFEPAPNWRALAAGVSLGRKVKGDDGIEHDFNALNGVPKELEAVVATFPGSKELLDPSFTVENFESELFNKPTLVHLATHFAFSAGDETRSFLLTGGGPVLGIGQARTMTAMSLQGVSLLTLSACDTGLGGSYGDGSEVESISVIFQKKGAEAVLSSLWPVADEPTRLLMTRFYANRKSHADWTKLECLRQAQLSLLHGDEKGSATPRAESVGGLPALKPDPHAPLSHPYYWAPFVLSGNWK